MANASSPITLEMTHSGRARCKEICCLQLIESSTPRVCVPMFAQGRTVAASFHLGCFVNNGISVETVTKSNAGKCKLSQKKFEKGDLRLLVRAGNAKFGLGLQAAKKLLPHVLSLLGKNLGDITGNKTLDDGAESTKRWREGWSVKNGGVSKPEKKSAMKNAGVSKPGKKTQKS